MTKQVVEEEYLVNYDVVTQFSGHQPNKGVKLVEAAKDIFRRVKETAMQCAIKGEFIEFNTVDELQKKLQNAVVSGFSIRVHDENIGG